MDNQNVSRDAQRKSTEALEVQEARLENRHNQYQKHQKQLIADENDNHEQIPQASASNNIEENDNYKQISQASASNNIEQGIQNMNPAAVLSELDKDLLRKFHSKMDKIKYAFCPVYNENFPLITLVMGECRQCYNEKTLPKKILSANNMDPDEVPEELQDLTEIEKMLIAQVFPQSARSELFRDF
ncbi:27276_t:CDS:2 [Gigaspora margarita]|uniref:27276_t:CDS:1 n=1 Tax=Gigaspora margarita TaxID=4874 RepID=A0ABN7UGJ9_GIGMA|nr:27276_t:CDS:2 [Gigaspora margarita]